jgi:hypothetical protein
MFMMIAGYLWVLALGWTDILPFTPVTLAVGFLLNGIAGTYFYISTLINMTNCVEYNEYLTGERNEAIVSAVRPLIVKFSSAARSLLTTLILICSGLYVLSQNVSSLETQKGLFNDKVAAIVSEESLDEMKLYVNMLNDYNSALSSLDKDSFEYEATLDEIDERINNLGSEHVVVRVQTKAQFIDTYSQMYILKMKDGNIVQFEQIKDLNDAKADEFFTTGYTYEASFVFSYTDENGEKIDVNLGTEVYKESDSLTTRIVLRILVTILPIVIVIASYYIQNKKFIVNEEFYDNMMKELEIRRKKQENLV